MRSHDIGRGRAKDVYKHARQSARRAFLRCPCPAAMLKLSLAAHFCAGTSARAFCVTRGGSSGLVARLFSRLRARFAGLEAWAGVAQLVEHLICNQRVGGSNPFVSSTCLHAGLRRETVTVGRIWLYCRLVLARIPHTTPSNHSSRTRCAGVWRAGIERCVCPAAGKGRTGGRVVNGSRL